MEMILSFFSIVVDKVMVEAGARAHSIYGVFLNIALYLDIRPNLNRVVMGLIDIDSITCHAIFLGCSFIS